MTTRRAWLIAVCVTAVGAMSISAHAEPDEPVEQSESTQAATTTMIGGAAETDISLSDEEAPWAAPVPMAQRQAARDFFLEANKLMAIPLFPRAAAKYKQALALWEHPAFYYNLAIVQMNLDQPVEAYHGLEKALRYGEAPLGPERHERALEYRKQLEQQLVRLEILCNEPGAAVALNGETLFVAPGRRQVMVRPGGHQIVASKKGRIPETRQVNTTPGEEISVQMATTPLPEISLESRRRWAVWVPWAVVVSGLAVVSGAGVLDYSSSVAIEDFDDEFRKRCARIGCEDGSARVNNLIGQLYEAEADKQIALALYVAGSAAFVAGMTMVYFNQPELRKKYPREDIAVIPMLAPGVSGIGAAMEF